MTSTQSYKVEQLQGDLGASGVGSLYAHTIRFLLTDSRRLLFPDATLFVALPGPRRSGAEYIPSLYQRGVRVFLVDKASLPASWETLFSDACFLVVPDTLKALQQLAARHRQQFHYPVIGITGSNGKTIVKEWLFQLLQHRYSIVRSPKSYNSQIGVPLSVWPMQAFHQLALLEAGISKPEEMDRLEEIIQPTIAVFTSLGAAHDEGFTSRAQKVQEKLKLFRRALIWIYPQDEPLLVEALNALADQREHVPTRISWGHSSASRVRVIDRVVHDTFTQLTIQWTPLGATDLKTSVLSIPFVDAASVDNVLTCCCVMLYLGVDLSNVASELNRLQPVAMRLERKPGIQQCAIINDTYNADLDSLWIALDFLAQQEKHRRTVILSDILETGMDEATMYAAIAASCKQHQVTRFIGIGPALLRHRALFAELPDSLFFEDTHAFDVQRHRIHFHQETILLKGARKFGFEQISRALEARTHQTQLEINLSALYHNLRVYRSMLQPGVRMMVMVKAAGYGAGSDEIAAGLQYHGVDYLAVAYADEGVAIRKAGITLPIMVLNPEQENWETFTEYALEPVIYSIALLESLGDYVAGNGLTYFPVHIELDTGMNRLGIIGSELNQLIGWLNEHASLVRVQSVFSHLAASEDQRHDHFTLQQGVTFADSSQALQQALGYPVLRHLGNTSAIHRYPNLQFDMVRLGIGIYGVDSTPAIQRQLQPVTRLTTHIAQIHTVQAGETIGYGRSSRVDRPSRIATVRIGYADGYPRRLSNGVGKMWVNGQLAPVIGRVCMDMTMLDVTDIPAKEGELVQVFGPQLPVQDVAIAADTIPYEILTGISARVKRVYFEE